MGEQRARRQFSDDFKRQVVAEIEPGRTSVSVVARRHDINANLLFRWRDDPRYAFQEQSFLPVEINTAVQDLKPAGDPPELSELGIWIAGDVRLVIENTARQHV